MKIVREGNQESMTEVVPGGGGGSAKKGRGVVSADSLVITVTEYCHHKQKNDRGMSVGRNEMWQMLHSAE